ncbi:hypothetical protein CR513_17132, partial [Mucuna pruriens]
NVVKQASSWRGTLNSYIPTLWTQHSEELQLCFACNCLAMELPPAAAVDAAMGSPTIMTGFCTMVLSRFLLIGIKIFHHVSQLQTSGTNGDVDVATIAWD